MTFVLIDRDGTYLRVADPSWTYHLDGTFSQTYGGRWNAPNSFPVVYLCRDIAVAKANVARKFEGLPYGIEDLKATEAPVLVETHLEAKEFADVVTNEGCVAAGLPITYPKGSDGEEVPWEACQPIGQRAWDEHLNGLACRSAATGGPGEELAWFQRTQVLHPERMLSFEEWFWE